MSRKERQPFMTDKELSNESISIYFKLTNWKWQWEVTGSSEVKWISNNETTDKNNDIQGFCRKLCKCHKL